MATKVARDLSFGEVANLTSFEDVRRYANWPEDVQAPLFFTLFPQDIVKSMIQHLSLVCIQSIAEKFPKLGKQLKELSGYPDSVNLDNFKVHLSLKSGFDVWVNGNAISDDIVNNVMIPEVKQIIHEAQKQVKKRRPNAFLEMEENIERAFKIPEKAHPAYGYPSQNLCDDLTEYHEAFKKSAREYLSPYTSIVAPSGTGKSYTVSQLAVKHNKYVIYLNFAPPGHAGYPGRSPYTPLILLTLDQVNSGVSFLARRNIMEWKWALIMKTLLCLARAARASGISPEDFFRYQTEKQYAPVQKRINSALIFVIEATKSSCPKGEHSTSLPDFAPFSDHFQSVFRDDTSESDAENSDEDSSEDNIQETSELRNEYASEDNCKANAEDCDMYDDSQHQISGQDSQSDLQFVICIDEARNLLFDRIDRVSLPFRSLNSALWFISQHHQEKSFFAVFLDTASTISNFTPPAIKDPSQKVALHDRPGRKIFPPHFRFFTKHLYAEPTPDQPVATSTSLATLLTFGHPLWGALALQGGPEGGIMELCMQKCEPYLGNDAFDDERRTGLLALLSYRIPFNFCTFTLAERLVSGWMHCLVDVSEDREKLMVVQPTDPILAIAAYRHGVTMGEKLVEVLAVLDHFLYWQSVNVGDIGEFVAGLILLLTFDANVGEYPKPIPLKGFVQSLLGKQAVTNFAAVCWKHLSDEVKEMFSHGQVFFNRFYRRITKLIMSDLYKMYRTCTACYLPTGLYGVNILIPVFIPKTQNREAYFGCILVQVKNQAYDNFDDCMKNSAYDYINTGCKQLGFDEVPTVGLTMCLQGKSTGTAVRPPSGNNKTNLGIILSVGLDSEQYPIFVGSRTRNGSQGNEQVLKALQSLVSEVNKMVLEENKDACEYLTFQSEFLP
ncbi:hypothetical protein HOO65_010083 [Ceratocystis lukuohia]|uniref:Uncharacterized protein n=1 Tax=Ceratocystis lukuohia TaxID=2019550 RepID=A0ABR4MR09_9PEZI